MTTENHDPWALLREARECVVGRCNTDLRDRIDAALAEHDAVPPSEEKVEWHTYERSTVLDGIICTIGYSPVADHEDPWWWRVQHAENRKWKFDRVKTEAEAKSAAIAAARGMR